MTSSQVTVGSLPLVRTQRTSSSRISAAVPRIESSPASLAAVSQSRIDMPVRVAPLTTSMGEKAWTCMPGTRSFTARAMSKYAVPGRSGWIPPCMQTSTAPTSHACAARSRDLVQGEGVRVGVGAALGEGAETAAGVADVGEVDVPRDDVRDLVADHVPAQRVRDPAELVQRRAVRVSRARAWSSVSFVGSSAALAQRLAYVGVDPGRDHAGGRRLRSASQSPYTSSKSLRRSPVRPSVSMVACRSVRPEEVKPSSGSCQGRPAGSAPSRARPVSGSARARTCGRSRGSRARARRAG